MSDDRAPTPASDAPAPPREETYYCAQCLMNGSGRFKLRDDACPNPRCVLYVQHYVDRPQWMHAAVCESCQRSLSEHGRPHEWDTERRPSCPAPSLTGTYRAAAPTPEATPPRCECDGECSLHMDKPVASCRVCYPTAPARRCQR